MEHSEEILNVQTIESASPSWTRSTLAHDQVIRWTKAKVRENSDFVLCWVKMWEGQVEEFKMPASYKELLGIDGEPIEFELNILSGITSLEILQKIQNVLRERNIEPEKLTDRIIFMPMFNDIDWTRKGNDGICKSNSEKVKTYAKTFLGPRADKKWYGTLPETPEGKCDSTATQMVERFKDTGHPVFKSISALSRGILKKNSDRDTIHCNADASNTDLLFRIIHVVDQLSMYGAVSNWCEQVGLTEDEKGQEKPSGKKESVTKGVLTSVKSQEVNLLVSSRRLASGSSLRENIQDIESLSERI